MRPESRFGSCPVCGGEDGYLDCGRGHWFVCDTHRVKWFAGSNMFASWRLPGQGEPSYRVRFESFLVVDGWVQQRNPPALPSAVVDALERVLEYLWADEARDYDLRLPELGHQHIFPALCDVRWWLAGFQVENWMSEEGGEQE